MFGDEKEPVTELPEEELSTEEEVIEPVTDGPKKNFLTENPTSNPRVRMI